MSDIFASTLLVVIIYCFWAVAAYSPRHTAATETEPETPIDYFPEPEETTDPEPEVVSAPVAPTKTTPKVITEPRPIAAYIPVKITPKTDAPALDTLTIRQLKKMASAAKIKRYSSLTKAQLIAALT